MKWFNGFDSHDKFDRVASSRHASGTNVAMGDGSQRVVNYEVDQKVWAMMAHMNDGQVFSLP
jgi:prepilin-type processing-associated H-X9-DG protein